MIKNKYFNIGAFTDVPMDVFIYLGTHFVVLTITGFSHVHV